MVIGKTSTGFSFAVIKRIFHSMKVTRVLVNMENGKATADEIMETAKKMLGADDFEKFIDHCDEVATDDCYGDEMFAKEFGEIVAKCYEDDTVKNS